MSGERVVVMTSRDQLHHTMALLLNTVFINSLSLINLDWESHDSLSNQEPETTVTDEKKRGCEKENLPQKFSLSFSITVIHGLLLGDSANAVPH